MAVGLIFHGIGQPKRTLDTGEAPFWLCKDIFDAILDRIAALPDPSSVRISFDDGNASDHDIALPALAARRLTADFFVLSGRIGQPGSLDAGQIRALAAAGHRIGSHGIAHLRWSGLDPAALAQELTGSRAALEALLGRPVTEAGIPFGAWSGRVLAALRAAGYTRAWSSDGGRFRPGAFLCPRSSVRGDLASDRIGALLTGEMPLARRLRRGAGQLRKRLNPG